jgi:hypothetical protein
MFNLHGDRADYVQSCMQLLLLKARAFVAMA